jgi:hypothetical protein
MRIALLAAAAVAAVSTVPASAMSSYVCTTNLVNAAAGTVAPGCTTQGPGPLGNKDVAIRRTVTVEVLAGAVDATLTCSGQTVSAHVSGPQPQLLNAWDDRSCAVTMVAAEPNTTAVATSTFSFVITLQ